ncbi:putative DNA double-strand break repair Rad50 ATPase [Halomicronema hongdechloris C2206]|uniref:Nuclease SbcCD subunit C n=1 Tax=Halomicronema hongdechloris C2206 TaxID=1641165 RepID=A0A1Z3HS54_9CYAN|nr:SMC family ATPase [Halomicronema hongdechloris]ASC73144.1 putative DNA double-strand break repair Rad50 ATPase [Halomicronema hongdechloris C2206]
MEILSVTLTNFKTHRDRHVEFQPGTNAICGQNGAGKTSILEAIAWVLFNYQGDYAKEDLIRNGSSSAQARVCLVSALDGRTYEVQRCTSRGYTLYDPQLQERLPYSRIKDEVMPWLRQHLGVPAGTDLAQLFARTIGVPQGTFTADFLLPTAERKGVFDKILKVDEYQAVYKQLNGLRRYAEAQVQALERDLAQYEEQLQAWPEWQRRHHQAQAQLQADEARLQQLTTDLTALQTQRQQLQAEVDALQALQTQAQTLTSEMTGRERSLELLQQGLEQANRAVAICETQRSAYEAYQGAEATLGELNQRYQARQRLDSQHRQCQGQVTQHQAEVTRLELQLESFSRTEAELQQLQPAIEQQQTVETQLNQVNQQLQQLQQARLEHQAAQRQLTTLESRLTQVQQQIDALQTQQAQLQDLPELVQRCDRIRQHLSRLEAAQQFEADLRQLVDRHQTRHQDYRQQVEAVLTLMASLQQSLPLLTQEAVTSLEQALETGLALNQDMLQALQEILADLQGQTDPDILTQQLTALEQQVQQRYRQQAAVAQLPEKQQQQQQLQADQAQLQTTLATLAETLAATAPLNQQQSDLTAALAALQDPRGQGQVLQRSLQQRPQVQRQYNQMQATQARLQQTLKDLERQLQAFADLDDAIEQQRQIQATHQAGYHQYLQHQQEAQRQPRVAAELQQAQAELTADQSQLARVQQQLQTQQQRVDPQQLAQIEQRHRELQSQVDRLGGSLPQQRQRLQELEQQLADLKQVAARRDRTLADRKRCDRIRRFINVARRTYKEAGPRITERYVQQITREADRLLRDLLNRPNIALDWTRDYEIQVQEGPHRRRFLNLSGGEQMCAALAVRLALLKVLADIDVAFFDEPTTNMDRARRESLAEAIARIKSFRQLFVISHDDTFEKVTENLVLVERQD